VKVASTWRAVRIQEGLLERELRQRHTLWLHGWCIGALVLLAMWGMAALQLWLGSQSLALRYAVTLGAGYLAYLGLLRLWAAALVGRRDGDGMDLPDLGGDWSPGGGGGSGGAGPGHPGSGLPPVRSGGGGDFGGGGAHASFDDGGGLLETAGETVGQAVGAAAEADEAAVVVVPVVLLFALGAALLLGTGSLLLLLFGSEALLAVALELAFAAVAGRTALRITREGWLGAAVRLTWKPLLGALACAVAVGGLLDLFVPQADTLVQAVRLLAR
jgi:uncharacterized membrane protein YgcG